MTHFKKLLSGLFVFITMLSFVVSTTGFTSYTHKCQHHDSLKSLAPIENACCSAEVKVKTEDSCCAVSSYIVDDDHSTCCTDEMSYHRLSDWYTLVDSEKITLPFRAIILTKNLKEIPQEPESVKEWELNHEALIKFSFPPKYLLYSHIKLDPPLI